jgi:hypothetical protein
MKNLNWRINSSIYSKIFSESSITIFGNEEWIATNGNNDQFDDINYISMILRENFLKKLYTKEKNNAILASSKKIH